MYTRTEKYEQWTRYNYLRPVNAHTHIKKYMEIRIGNTQWTRPCKNEKKLKKSLTAGETGLGELGHLNKMRLA